MLLYKKYIKKAIPICKVFKKIFQTSKSKKKEYVKVFVFDIFYIFIVNTVITLNRY